MIEKRVLPFVVLVGLWVPSPVGFGQPLTITEFMAANDVVLFDADGNSSDWIEVYNLSTGAVNLDGWSLTDSDKNPRKWLFPARELGPGEFVVVFASSKDRRPIAGELHANFKLSADGEFLALVAPVGAVISRFAPFFPPQVAHASYGARMDRELLSLVVSGSPLRYHVPADDGLGLAWTEQGFDDQGWSSGSSPIGFDRKGVPTFADLIAIDVGPRMQGQRASVYLRVPFEVSDPASLDALVLRLRYNDGFVAYVNGREVARRNAPSETHVGSTAPRVAAESAAFFFEFINVSSALGMLRTGNNVLAIHALNRGASNPDLFVLPELDGVRVLGVMPETHEYFAAPTPGSPNGDGVPGVVREPRFSQVAAVLSEPVLLELSADQSAEIRVTTDRSEPTERSLLYERPIVIDRNMEVRARAFAPGILPSITVRHVYAMLDADLADFSSDLPVVIYNTRSPLDPSIPGPGSIFILERGAEGRTRLTQPVEFAGDAFMASRGSSTARLPKKQYRLEIRDHRGNDLDVPVLGMPAESDWILFGTHRIDPSLMRNAFMYEISNRMGRYAVRGRFCEVFLNASSQPVSRRDYIGVYSFFEKIKRGPDRVDVEALRREDTSEPELTGGYILKIDRRGDGETIIEAGGSTLLVFYPEADDFTQAQESWITNYIETFSAALKLPEVTDPTIPLEQKRFAELLDVDSWIDHHMLNDLSRNSDGLGLSTYLFKKREGKLEYGPIWDFDRAVGSASTGISATDGWDCGKFFGMAWWGGMFRDPLVWQRYKDRYLGFRAGPLSDRNIRALIDRMAAEIAEAQARNFDRWGRGVILHENWEGEVEYLREWVVRRTAWMDSQLIPAPVLSAPTGVVPLGFEFTLTLPVSVPAASCPDDHGIVTALEGEILYTLNGPDPRTADGVRHPEALTYQGERIPVTENVRVRARTFDRGGASDLVEAGYLTSLASLVVTEIMYNPVVDPGDAFTATNFEFVELQNVGDSPVPLAGAELVQVEVTFTGTDVFGAELGSLGPGEYVVLVRNVEAFVSRYGAEGIRIGGEFSSRRTLPNSGSELVLMGSFGEELLRFRYEDGWYPSTDGQGHALVIVDATAPRETWGAAMSWRPSHQVGGSPGRPDSPPRSLQLPGDVNQDNRLNIADPILMAARLFQGVVQMPCASEEANARLFDTDGDGKVNLADVIYTLSHLFRGGAPPVLGVECVSIEGCPSLCD